MKNIIIAIIILFCASMHAQEQMEIDGTVKTGYLWVNSAEDYTCIRLGRSYNDRIYVDNNSDPNSTFGGGGIFFRVQTGLFDENFHEDYNQNYIDAMMISDEGNVGIGDRTPDSKLVVNGTIKAKEVIITAQPTADFVFADDYELRPLSEIESFVGDNQHLPGVPSAKQMQEEGMGVAKMNQLLLQKVEELTLYMIDQQKRIEELEGKLN